MSLIDKIKTNIPGNFNEAYNFAKRKELMLCIRNNVVVPPYEVLIHPSSYCNLTCEWCIGEYVTTEESVNDLEVHYKPKNKNLVLDNNISNPDVMLELIRNITSYRKRVCCTLEGVDIDKEFRVENISFSGITGEPLVAKKAVKAAIEELFKNNIRIGMFTNGLLIEKDDLDTLTKMSYINISLDAGSNEVYARLKCSGNKSHNLLFDNVLSKINMLVEYKKNTGRDIEVNCSYLIYPENFELLYETAIKLKALGVNKLRLKRDIYGHRLLDSTQRSIYRDIIHNIKQELVDDMFNVIEVHDIDNVSEQVRDFSSCFIQHMMASVGSDGKMYPCNYHPKKNGYMFGNLLTKSFEEIWISDERLNIVREIPSICPKVCDPFKTRSNRLYEKVGSKPSFHIALEEARIIFKELV